MVKVNVKNGTLDQKEIDAYVQYAIEANPGKLVTELDIDIDRFNNAKRAEVEDRVKHSIAPDVEDDIYVTA